MIKFHICIKKEPSQNNKYMKIIKIILLMGGESPKEENHQIDSTQGADGPNYSLDQAHHNQDSPVSETEEDALPEEPEEQTLLERLETNH